MLYISDPLDTRVYGIGHRRAILFGVTNGTISNIRHGRSHQHLAAGRTRVPRGRSFNFNAQPTIVTD